MSLLARRKLVHEIQADGIYRAHRYPGYLLQVKFKSSLREPGFLRLDEGLWSVLPMAQTSTELPSSVAAKNRIWTCFPLSHDESATADVRTGKCFATAVVMNISISTGRVDYVCILMIKY